MQMKAFISIILCLNILYIPLALNDIHIDESNLSIEAEANVITESDAGGGDMTGSEVLVILLAGFGLFVIIYILILLIK